MLPYFEGGLPSQAWYNNRTITQMLEHAVIDAQKMKDFEFRKYRKSQVQIGETPQYVVARSHGHLICVINKRAREAYVFEDMITNKQYHSRTIEKLFLDFGIISVIRWTPTVEV